MKKIFLFYFQSSKIVVLQIGQMKLQIWSLPRPQNLKEWDTKESLGENLNTSAYKTESACRLVYEAL